MGFIFRIIKFLIKILFIIAVIGTIITLIPNLPPYTKFTAIKQEPTQPRVGVLAPNGDLNKAERLFTDKLLGPEAFEVFNGEVYTSLATGEIVKISPGGHVTFVTKIGQPCTGIIQEHICGRPLGFQIDENTKQLYVADAYHGIWKVDLKTDKKQLLVSPRVAIAGRQPMIFNSIALDKNGDFFWTDSSSDFHLKDGVMSLFSDPSGRLFHYNAARNESKVLLDDLWFANGVAVSADKQFVVVSETSRYRLMKYYIDGPKKGKSEVFVAGLPGTPDNLRALPDGSGVLVALYTVFDENQPLIVRTLSELPGIRKLLTRIQKLLEMQFEFLNNMYPHIIFEEMIYNIGHFKTVAGLVPKMAGLVQVDWNGNVVASHYNLDESLGHISDAIVHNGKLYTGAPHLQNFIGAVPAPPLLKKAFEKKETKKAESEAKATKPVETPRVQERKEVPKQAKPVEQPRKPAETVKTTPPPADTKSKGEQQKPPQPKPTTPPPKPAEVKTTTAKPEVKTPPPEVKTTTPKPTTQKPVTTTTTTPKPTTTTTTPKPTTTTTTPKPTTTTTTPKPTTTTTTPKPTTKTPPPTPKVTTPKPEPTPKPAEETKKKVESQQKPVKENVAKAKGEKPGSQIPIKEEIPSDTPKPTKETLKVIKKAGPAEIPNPTP